MMTSKTQDDRAKAASTYLRKPKWLRIGLNQGRHFNAVRDTLKKSQLNTVCEEAKCPNIHECWDQHKMATFMILGDVCTRHCKFCAVKTGLPSAPDHGEPERVAQSVAELGLKHVVITMVTRDDLSDGGAEVLAATIRAIRVHAPNCTTEVLASDLMGNADAIATVVAAKPEINSHNVETVPRLTPLVRSRSSYSRSLEYLRKVKVLDSSATTKSSLMLGLGEEKEEILTVMDDLRRVGVDILNLGQYLQPSRTHAPVKRYWTPEEFFHLQQEAYRRGFTHCASGPLVRSSYHAADQLEQAVAAKSLTDISA
jgi:lipoic acid synthetase